MIVYQRTQNTRALVMVPLYYGWLLIVMVVNFEGLAEVLPFLVGPTVLVTVLFFGFLRLTVTVTLTEVRLAYTFGLPRKRIERSGIASAQPFRIPWWYGLGIRGTPKGWMWSIWGRDTVLLRLGDGRGFLIGTDDPQGLAAALGYPATEPLGGRR